MPASIRITAIITVLAAGASGCATGPGSALQRLLDARALSSDLLVHFTKTADAGNRAVMAGTEDAFRAFSREAEDAMVAVQNDVDALGPILISLSYEAETRLLATFRTQFAEYRTLNDGILELAAENRHLNAQRLSFGSGQQAAGAFKDALDPVNRDVRSLALSFGQKGELTATCEATLRELHEALATHAVGGTR